MRLASGLSSERNVRLLRNKGDVSGDVTALDSPVVVPGENEPVLAGEVATLAAKRTRAAGGGSCKEGAGAGTGAGAAGFGAGAAMRPTQGMRLRLLVTSL